LTYAVVFKTLWHYRDNQTPKESIDALHLSTNGLFTLHWTFSSRSTGLAQWHTRVLIHSVM